MFSALLLASALICGCGSSGGKTTTAPPSTPTAAAPPGIVSFTNSNLQNGAVVVNLAFTTPGSTIHYTLDGTTPTTASQIYQAPILVSTNLTIKAIASASGYADSTVASRIFTPNIASGTLVWSDEFSGSGTTNRLPDSSTWTYDTGFQCCGNNEQETYCAAGSSTAPCDPSNPNAYVDAGGILHLTARNPSGTTYTSARMKTEGLFSFMYGRIEARIKIPESQGMWPAFWLLGNNILTLSWPGCGELDVMEHIDGSNPPPAAGQTPEGYDWIAGSVHGGTSAIEANGSQTYHPTGFSAAAWHTYGMIWSKGQIQYYVDDPSNVYTTFTPATFNGTWPFDQGPQFILLNLAVGGSWPGNVDSTTVFPGDMQVDYVRIYTN